MNKVSAPLAGLDGVSHEELLNVLARAEKGPLSVLAEGMIDRLGEIEVLVNRTGLMMLPMRDTAGGAVFHLGEVLVAEAHVCASGQEGYGMRRGRDLEAAMAMAVIDLAVACDVGKGEIAAFVAKETTRQMAQDEARLREVAATRVDMETF